MKALELKDFDLINITPPAVVLLRPHTRLTVAQLINLKEQIDRMPLPEGVRVVVVEDCDVFAMSVQGAELQDHSPPHAGNQGGTHDPQ